MKWFKFYGQDFMTDPKMGFLTTPQRLLWVYLLAMASQSERKDGVLRYVTLDHLRSLAGITTNDENWKLTDNTLEVFEEMKLITIVNETTIKITKYGQYQELERTNAERQAMYRQRKHNKSNTNVTTVLQQSNARIEENRIDKNNTKEKSIEKKNFSSLEEITDTVLQEISEKYHVPLAFVASKYDDMMNWHDSNPRKNTKLNWKATLMNWVKRDAVQMVNAQKLPSKSFDAVPYLREKGEHEIIAT